MTKKAIILSVTLLISFLMTGFFNHEDNEITKATDVALKYKIEELEQLITKIIRK